MTAPDAGAGAAPGAGDRWAAVERLFDDALAQPADARAAWLAAAPAEPAVRDEVAAMLAAHEDDDGLLDRPLAGALVDTPAGGAPARLHPAELALRLEDALADRYIVERELGRGGAATVFLAHERKHARPVVLKVLNPEVARTWGRERFEREVQIAARLSHPHILGLIDSGEADGLFYYVMPYVRGETLRARLDREGALPLEAALTLLRDVADALAHAHRAGIVHRDLKPANVLGVGDHAFLMDFGVAKLIAPAPGESQLTGQGLAIGTPAYMAPEQLDAALVDGRADLYAWGLLAYEMLAGTLPPPPRAGEGPAAPALAERRPHVPRPLSDLVAACLAADPGRRPADADALLAVLAGLVAPRPRPPRSPLRLGGLAALDGGSVRRRLLLAALAGAVVTAGFVASAAWRRPDAAPGPTASVPSPVAVAPLANETGDASLDSWGRLAGDWLSQGLQQTGAVQVVPWLSARNIGEAARAERASGRAVDLVERLRDETGAATVVTGAYYVVGDSLLVRADIVDAREGSVLHALTPIVVARDSASLALRLLRERLTGAVALMTDERVARAAEIARRPPAFASYQAFDRGLQRYLAQEYAASLPDLHRAFALDTTFLTPLMYAINAYWALGEHARMDSLLRVVGPRRDELTEYGRHVLASLEARLAGDGEAARAALLQAIHAAPGSRATYGFAATSLDTGHPEDALVALGALDTTRTDVRATATHWLLLAQALHGTGDHARELAAVHTVRTRYPEQATGLALQARALAALGREAALDSALAAAPAQPAGTHWSAGAVMVVAGQELRAHGRAAAGDRWIARAAGWLEAQHRLAPADRAHRYWLATARAEQGRWAEAAALWDALAAAEPERLELRGQAALAAARAGVPRAEAEGRLGAAASHERGLHAAYRARLAAIAGDHARAATLLADAVRDGLPGLAWLHAAARAELVPLRAAGIALPVPLVPAAR